MALTPQLVQEIVRQRLGSSSDEVAARVLMQIPHALKSFGSVIAADPHLRPLLQTDRRSTRLPIAQGDRTDANVVSGFSNGIVTLSSGYDTWQFLLEWLDVGQIYFQPATTISTINPGTDRITLSTPLNFEVADGMSVILTSTGGLPGGYVSNTLCYVYDYNGTDALSLVTTYNDPDTLIDFSTAGTGLRRLVSITYNYPLQRLRSPAQANLPNYLDGTFTYFYVQDGSLVVLRDDCIGGMVACALPTYPLTLAAMPDSEEAERIFLQIITDMVVQPASQAVAQTKTNARR